MKLQDAIILRIEQLCIERSMKKHQLSLSSGIAPTTLTSIKMKRSKKVQVHTIYWICEGFDISLEEFFSSPLFNRENIME